MQITLGQLHFIWPKWKGKAVRGTMHLLVNREKLPFHCDLVFLDPAPESWIQRRIDLTRHNNSVYSSFIVIPFLWSNMVRLSSGFTFALFSRKSPPVRKTRCQWMSQKIEICVFISLYFQLLAKLNEDSPGYSLNSAGKIGMNTKGWNRN